MIRIFLWISALTLLVSCSSYGSYVWVSQVPPPPPSASSAIRVGDKIQVVVYGQDAMSGEFEVRPGGDVALPVIGRVMAAGKGTDALASELEQRLKGVLADAHVTVILAARKPVTITVVGEVKTPGHYEVRDGEGVLEALARAGGLTPYADSDGIFVIRRAQPSPRVRFEYSKLTAADPASVGFELRDGDIVVAE